MTRILRANLKEFLGAGYERIPKTLVVWVIVFLSLRAAEIRLEIAPRAIWLTALCLTAGGFAGALSSGGVADSLRGQLMLPESPAEFHAALFISVLVYTFCTKTGLLLTVYLALGGTGVPAIAGFTVCFVAGGAAVYPLAFRSGKKTGRVRFAGGAGHGFIKYLLRYLLSNKNYLANTAALWAFGCVFAVFMGKTGPPEIFPLGLALMCLNTPLGILLSGDGALYRQAVFLPGQVRGIFLPYALFAAAANISACAVYSAAWCLTAGTAVPAALASAPVFSAAGAALTVLLEMKFPLLTRQTESDLWHHPRKYIVPGIMTAFALIYIALTGGL